VVAELQAAAERVGVRIVLQHDGVAKLESTGGRGTVKRLLPLVGFPDAVTLHEHYDARAQASAPWDGVLYDSLGILPAAESHLNWLNRYLPSKSQAIQGIEAWLKTNLA
jgi:hypothetical protein